jgi:16S rRNA processing protein RimM
VLLVVGRLGRPHGLRGELTVEVRTDEPELRLRPGAVLQTEPEGAGPLTVDTARWHGGRLLVGFAGVVDRGRAEALRGVLLQADVDPRARPSDPEEFYDHQLVGLAVVTVEGTTVGEVEQVVHLPGQDLLAVRREHRAPALVPLTLALVPEIDLAGRRVVIAPPPGLLDLDRETGPDRGAAPEHAGPDPQSAPPAGTDD